MSLGFVLASIEQGMLYGIMALGVYMTFRILNYADLSVDGSLPLGAAVSARLIIAGINPIISVFAAVAAGALAGGMTGFLNTRLKITGLLSGILTMSSLYSINLRIMGRSNIPLLQQPTVFGLAADVFGGSRAVSFLLLGIIELGVMLFMYCFLRTQVGFALRASGDNPQMVRSLGVNTDNMKLLGLVISNAIVSLSGALAGQYMGFADVGMGIGTVVAGLASVIIGEVLVGKRGIGFAIVGVAVGSIVYRLCISLALSYGFAASDLKLMTALLVIIALSAPNIKRAVFAVAVRE
ncbi:MAG: ABC transporter permease [Firmicutes bacterium]|nr:ABC transporter permease [Bacillota bacterium]